MKKESRNTCKARVQKLKEYAFAELMIIGWERKCRQDIFRKNLKVIENSTTILEYERSIILSGSDLSTRNEDVFKYLVG